MLDPLALDAEVVSVKVHVYRLVLMFCPEDPNLRFLMQDSQSFSAVFAI
jgi:hypothetical protein